MLFSSPPKKKEWASVSFAFKPPERTQPVVKLQKVVVKEWAKHEVVAVAVDQQTFTLRDIYTEKLVRKVSSYPHTPQTSHAPFSPSLNPRSCALLPPCDAHHHLRLRTGRAVVAFVCNSDS